MDYKKLLRDPKWQRKRLKILERDKFRCKHCASDSGTLHVHHSYYEYGKKPWEYEDESLITLCNYCHEQEHIAKSKFYKELNLLLKNGNAYQDLLTYLQNYR